MTGSEREGGSPAWPVYLALPLLHFASVKLTFFCACGCMAEVKRSLRDYVVRGAIIAGHSRRAGHR